VHVLQLFTELIALPFSFERPMNSSSHLVSIISTVFVMSIILLASDTASLSSVTNCYTTIATFNKSLLEEQGACTERPVF
jgi:hypothetical protein